MVQNSLSILSILLSYFYYYISRQIVFVDNFHSHPLMLLGILGRGKRRWVYSLRGGDAMRQEYKKPCFLYSCMRRTSSCQLKKYREYKIVIITYEQCHCGCVVHVGMQGHVMQLEHVGLPHGVRSNMVQNSAFSSTSQSLPLIIILNMAGRIQSTLLGAVLTSCHAETDPDYCPLSPKCAPGHEECGPRFDPATSQFHVKDTSCNNGDPNSMFFDKAHNLYHVFYQHIKNPNPKPKP